MCEICGRKNEVSRSNVRINYYNCPMCGEYGVTAKLSTSTLLDEGVKQKLSHLLAERRLMGKRLLVITRDANKEEADVILQQYDILLNDYPKSALEILDRAFLNLSRLVDHPAQMINLPTSEIEFLFARNMNEAGYVLRQFQNNGLISIPTYDDNCRQITIEAKGWQRLSELQRTSAGDTNQVFVAMWFDKKMDTIYSEGIMKAIEHFDTLKPFRIDLSEHNNKICDQIIAEIKKSKFMIADFSGERGGVYFEAGFAQGMGIPVIWTVHKSYENSLHFDTRQYNHIIYETEAELCKRLIARIEATVL